MTRRPRSSPLFPSPPLSRSDGVAPRGARAGARGPAAPPETCVPARGFRSLESVVAQRNHRGARLRQVRARRPGPRSRQSAGAVAPHQRMGARNTGGLPTGTGVGARRLPAGRRARPRLRAAARLVRIGHFAPQGPSHGLQLGPASRHGSESAAADGGPAPAERRSRGRPRADHLRLSDTHMRRQPPSRFRQLFLANVREVKGRLVFAGLCTLGATAAELLKPWPLKIILDHVILDKPISPFLRALHGLLVEGKVPLLLEAAGAIVVIALAGGLFSYFQIFITSSIGYKMVYALRRELFTHLQTLSLAFHNRARSGDLLTKIAGDTNTLKDVFADSILKFTSYVLTVVGMLAIMAAIDWKIGLIALATLPFLAYSLLHLYRKTKLSVKTQKRQEGKVASRMSEVLQAVPLVQAFARERYEAEQFDAVTAETLRESIRVARLEAAATRSSEIITAVGTAGAVLFGAFQVFKGRMLPGDLVLIVQYLTSMYRPMRQLAKLSTDFSKAMAAAERVSEILDIEPEIRDLPGALPATGLRGEIVFRVVSFDYGDGKDVLRDVSFSVSPGQRLALVGVSGARQSPIVSPMLRLDRPQRGTIPILGPRLPPDKAPPLR